VSYVEWFLRAPAVGEAATLSDAESVQRSSFPITFPLTTGPGTIAASTALGTPLMVRLTVFMLLCNGIQIMWTGWAELNGLA
jgi:multiple antibiotic resistance protein